MLTFIWHVFLVVWVTGCCAAGYWVWTHRPQAQLDRQVQQHTRIAELQARERRALDAR